QGQRRRLRHAIRRQAVRRVSASASARTVRRHRNRTGHRSAHYPSPWRGGAGRWCGGSGRDLHLLASESTTCGGKDGEHAMTTLGRILIVEDDPNDVELTLTALTDYNLANEVVITRDGQQELD